MTGKSPFSRATDAVELIRKHQEEFPVPPGEFVPGLPRQIADIIRTMMGKRPEERYPSMAVVVDVLEAVLGVLANRPQGNSGRAPATRSGRPPTLWHASPARRLRFRILALGAAIWLGFAACSLLWGWAGRQPACSGSAPLTALAALIASGIVHRFGTAAPGPGRRARRRPAILADRHRRSPGSPGGSLDLGWISPLVPDHLHASRLVAFFIFLTVRSPPSENGPLLRRQNC